MSRTKAGQKKHDERVLKSAEYYEKQGYKVSVDLPNHDKPKKIGGFIPDLIAKKKGEEIIVEIETKSTIKSDKDQHQAFKEYADKSEGRKFKKKIV